MKDNSSIHELARPEEKSGKIKFIHSDGSEHTFSTCVNDMTGCRMSWFDNCTPDVDRTIGHIKSVFGDIRKKAKVLESVGDF